MAGRVGVAILTGLALLFSACSRSAPPDSASGGIAGEAQLHENAPQAQIDYITSEATITVEALTNMIADLPAEMVGLIEADRKGFLDLLYQVVDGPEDLLWIADKEHSLPPDYEPPDLVDLDDYADRLLLSRPDHRLRRVILSDLVAMVDAASADGVDLEISSTYRSYAYQQEVYEGWVAKLGQEEADRTSARPGHSQHQLGTTIDFGCICDAFGDSDAGRWLADNEWRYGFSMSYPHGGEEITGYAYESWHYRYVGPPAAQLQEKYFSGMQHHMLKFVDSHRELLVAARR